MTRRNRSRRLSRLKTAGGNDKTDTFFKNVQVLKGLPAELMQPSMQLMEISLGVHCNYCHDNDGAKRELDTKPQKAIARRMITMTQDINRTMFNGTNRVTCFTCHQGHTKPGAVVPYNDQLTREETTMPIAAVPGPQHRHHGTDGGPADQQRGQRDWRRHEPVEGERPRDEGVRDEPRAPRRSAHRARGHVGDAV